VWGGGGGSGSSNSDRLPASPFYRPAYSISVIVLVATLSSTTI